VLWCGAVHYDPPNDKLSVAGHRLSSHMERLLKVWVCALLWNFVSTIVTVAGGAAPGIHILYVFLWLLLVTPLWVLSWQYGYRAVAGVSLDQRVRYLIGQSVMALFELLFIVVFSGNMHGLAGLAPATDPEQTFGYGTACTPACM
jgi:hypothetical protein